MKTVVYRSFATAAGILLLAACQRSEPIDNAQPYYHVVDALNVQHSESYAVERRFSGLLVPRQTTDIGFEQGGELAALLVDEGETVERGRLIAALDTRILDAQAQELRAQRAELRAQRELNQSNVKRQQDLKLRGFAADQRLDELAAEHDAIAANLQRIEAALAANQVRIDKSKLVAPFAGTVSRRFVDAGAVVSGGQAVFRLLESAEMEIRVGVPPRLLGRLSVGDSVSFTVANQRGSGEVLAIGSDVTRATLTVPVRVSMDDSIAAVAGDQAYLIFAEEVEQSGFWVPLTALTDGMRGLWNVYVLSPDQARLFRLEARDVQIASLAQDRAYLYGALRDGELIAAAGLQRLVPGQRVRVAETNAALATSQ